MGSGVGGGSTHDTDLAGGAGILRRADAGSGLRPPPHRPSATTSTGDHGLDLVEERRDSCVPIEADRARQVHRERSTGPGLRRLRFRDVRGGDRSERLPLHRNERRCRATCAMSLEGGASNSLLLFRQPGVVTCRLSVSACLGAPFSALMAMPPGDQVVPRVAVSNLGDVPGVPGLLDGLLEDDLHRAVRGAGPSHEAFLTAVATSR